MNDFLFQKLTGVWSAAPTPLTEDGKVDEASVERMVRHHLRLGVNGLFLAGTCGEGALLSAGEKSRLVRAAVAAAEGRLAIAVQVSDETPERIARNAERAAEDGAALAAIGPPAAFGDPNPERLRSFYLEAIRSSSLPVGLYDLGDRRPHSIPREFLAEVYREHGVHYVKDSSLERDRMVIALRAREANPNLRLFNGDEFHCVSYLENGYDGLMLGGGVFNGYIAGMILRAVAEGDEARAESLQERMTAVMHAVYGGPEVRCWLSGLKHLLVEMGIFSTVRTLSDYPLTDECRAAIRDVQAREGEILFPGAEPVEASRR